MNLYNYGTIGIALPIILMFCGQAVRASETQPNSHGTLYKDKPTLPQNPNRHKMPGKHTIGITYNSTTQECHFTLPAGINHISIEAISEEDGFYFYGMATAADPTAIISLEQGEYMIICTTDDGSVFSGLLNVV